MSEKLTDTDTSRKEVSGIWVLLIFVVLLGTVLTLAAVTQ